MTTLNVGPQEEPSGEGATTLDNNPAHGELGDEDDLIYALVCGVPDRTNYYGAARAPWARPTADKSSA